jgi:hypothetical protein
VNFSMRNEVLTRYPPAMKGRDCTM